MNPSLYPLVRVLGHRQALQSVHVLVLDEEKQDLRLKGPCVDEGQLEGDFDDGDEEKLPGKSITPI